MKTKFDERARRVIRTACVCVGGLAFVAAVLSVGSAADAPGAAGTLDTPSYCNIVVVGKGVGLDKFVPLPTATPVPGGAAPPMALSFDNGEMFSTIAPSFSFGNAYLGQPAWATVEFSRRPDFVTKDAAWDFGLSQGVLRTEFFWNLVEGTTYYVRARSSFDGVLWGDWSSVMSFLTGSGGTVAGTPTLLEPPDGSAVDTLRPTFRWTAVPGATLYGLKIGRSTSYEPGTERAPYDDLAPGTSLSWMVKARNAYGYGSWSEVWTITTPAAGSPEGQAGEGAGAQGDVWTEYGSGE